MRVYVKMYNRTKYNSKAKVIRKIDYDIENFRVYGREDEETKEIESNLNYDECDLFHEYLVLYLGNDETATFNNSEVDLFRW